jgi:hypothetical protein
MVRQLLSVCSTCFSLADRSRLLRSFCNLMRQTATRMKEIHRYSSPESAFSIDRVEEVPKISQLKVDDVISFFVMHVFRRLVATVQ